MIKKKKRKSYSDVITFKERAKLVKKYGRNWRKFMGRRKDHTSTSWGYLNDEKVSAHKSVKHDFQKVKTSLIQKRLPPTVNKTQLENLKRLLEEEDE